MRRTAALAAIGVAALAGTWARRDYRAWLALGEGGLPANPKGWLITSHLRLRKADPITTTVYDPAGRATSVIRPLELTTTTAYDKAARVTAHRTSCSW